MPNTSTDPISIITLEAEIAELKKQVSILSGEWKGFNNVLHFMRFGKWADAPEIMRDNLRLMKGGCTPADMAQQFKGGGR